MRWIVWTIVGLVGLVGIVALIGWLLPVGHVASRSATFKQPPETVYAAVADLAGYPKWFKGVSRIEMLESTNGRVRFREHMSTGPVIMEVEEASPPGRYVTRIADPDQPFGGTWTFEITPAAGGARLTITERGEVYNPIFRFMSRFIFGQTGTMESFLKGLGGKFGETVVPS